MNVSRRGFIKGLALACGTAGTAKVARAAHHKLPAADAVGLLYDSTRCVGCNACVQRCKEVNGLPPSTAGDPLHNAPKDLDAITKNVIKSTRWNDALAFFKNQCMHCVDPACVSVCMIGALHKVEHGIVAYDASRCIGCRYCQVACPFDVPKFEWASSTPKIVKCELCRERLAVGGKPGCVEVCPREAVIYGTRVELLAEAHRRLKERPALYQPKVYGETDGGGTQVLYLSAAPFGKLGLPELGRESPPSLPETIQGSIYKGFIAPAALYAALGFVVLRNRRSQATEAAALPPEKKEGDK